MVTDGRYVKSVERLRVQIFEYREQLGKAAAASVARSMRETIASRGEVNVVFAAAPSQNEFLDELCAIGDLDWAKVNAFHLDEYITLPKDAEQRFANFLNTHLFSRVRPGRVFYHGEGDENAEKQCARYGDLLSQYPLDIACIGVGENGHLAFNDPPVADFADPLIVKVVELEERCRQQQVHDGAFTDITAVPRIAVTMTVPAIMAAKEIHCMVPGPTKAEAINAMLVDPISTDCPASILRRHDRATLYIDKEAAAIWQKWQR